MNIPTIQFENIDINCLIPIKIKRERSVYSHPTKDLVYKLYVPNWEFARQPSLGFNLGYYSKDLVPNFQALIKDKQGRDRGYITTKVPRHQILDVVLQPLFSIPVLSQIAHHEIRLTDKILPAYRPRTDFLATLLRQLFTRALITNSLFLEISAPNIWMNNQGYYIFDLDALRSFDWVFCTNKNDQQYERKINNRKHFNRDFKRFIELHHLNFPREINQVDDFSQFWKEFVDSNKEIRTSNNLLANAL